MGNRIVAECPNFQGEEQNWTFSIFSEKRCIFLYGEVRFLLTCPLMGDPVVFPTPLFLLIFYQRKKA